MALANISNKIISCCDATVDAIVFCYKALFFLGTNAVVLITIILCADPDVQYNAKLFWIAASISCVGVVSSWKSRRYYNANTDPDPAVKPDDSRG